MLIKIIRVLTWDLLSCAQLSEAPLALPASADGFESRRSLLLYDLPTEHMQSKPLPRLRFFGRHQVHGCGAYEYPSTSGIPISQISTLTDLARRCSIPCSADGARYMARPIVDLLGVLEPCRSPDIVMPVARQV